MVFKITLAAARVNADMNISDATVALGISKYHLRKYEIGEAPVPEELIQPICDLYNVPIEFLKIKEIRCLTQSQKLRKIKRLYRIWSGMKQRCNNPKSRLYLRYGGRGIKVCQEWEDSYDSFAVWALENGYSDDLTIDRIDSNLGYSPENCRWIPAGLNASLAQSKKYGRTEEWSFQHWNDHHH